MHTKSEVKCFKNNLLCKSTLKNFTHGGLGHTKSLPSFFPSFSLFSLFFPLFSSSPPSSPLFPFFPPHGVRLCPSFGCQHLRFNPREKPDTCAPSPAAKHSPSYSLPACVCVCVLNLPSCVCILCETII